ncbi:response regulator [Deinococcus sp. Arct2-2]|uniref:response regulator n=1 Tax=Deinococcus sp. Arct2-2 TaxID=2568653 RepID=UPI003211CCBC
MRALRVLLVDDDPLDRLMAEEAFALLEQPCTLETAHSGLAALTQLQRPGAVLPDVVLLDLNMPGLNGFEVLATLKGLPQLRALPVVILTTSANPGDMTQAQTLQASGYLIKSIHFQTFFQQIEKFIDVWLQSQRAMIGMNVGESRAM